MYAFIPTAIDFINSNQPVACVCTLSSAVLRGDSILHFVSAGMDMLLL